MRTVFIGAVHGSRIALQALLDAGHCPTMVVTLPPELSSRHSDFSDIATMARQAGCEVHYTRNINAPALLEVLRAVSPDVCMTIGWSQICKPEFLGIARLGNIGFHPAPLPRFRGRAVIPWTILCGETETGSTLFWLDEGTDSGDILLQHLFAVADDETAQSLYHKHTSNLSEMLPRAIAMINAGTASRRPQDHTRASYCAKRTPEDGLIDWTQSATTIDRFVRAVGEPYPGAFSYTGINRLTVNGVRKFKSLESYIGLPGQVQRHTADGFLVMTGDGTVLEVTDWTSTTNAKPKLHTKLTGTPK